MNNIEIPCLYILVRTNLPSLNSGKGMAQVAHAANAFINRWKYQYEKIFPDSQYLKLISKWESESGNGFGTTIVTSIPNKEVLLSKIHSLPSNIPGGIVTDDTYPYVTNMEMLQLISSKHHTQAPVFKQNGQVVCFRREITCGYIFIDKNLPEQLRFVSDLSLHP